MDQHSPSFYRFFLEQGYSEDMATLFNFILLSVSITLIAVAFHFVVKTAFISAIKKFAARSKSNIDDILVEKGVFVRLSFAFPAILIYSLDEYFFADFPAVRPVVLNATDIYIVLVILFTVSATISALRDILSSTKMFKNKPVGSYTQVLQILNYSIATIFIVSILIGKSPLYLLSALGAVTAILLLVFKDTILGLVASIQLSGNDMIRIGDWVTIEHYGADGDVIEINLSTVKIKNFDNTITTVPTYALISNSFRNWRGMLNSGGRRIKRSIQIDMHSVHMLTNEEIETFKKVTVLKNYITEKEAEIEQYNSSISSDELPEINGRRLTNIGLFRKYMEHFLKNHPKVNQSMTCMVRQLQPSPEGIPLEVYCFSNDKTWVTYEEIMSDVFDHILAVAPKFGIRVYQRPGRFEFELLANKGD